MALLVKWEDNWADEMDLCGFHVYQDGERWHQMVRETRAQHFQIFPTSFSVGGNEEIDYDSIDTWLDRFQVIEISDIEAELIIGNFGEEYGFFPIQNALQSWHGEDAAFDPEEQRNEDPVTATAAEPTMLTVEDWPRQVSVTLS